MKKFRVTYLTKSENGVYDKSHTLYAETLDEAKVMAENIVKGDVYVVNIYTDTYIGSVRKEGY